jgi:hypothetical protein
MARLRVKTAGLNLRRAPQIEEGNIIAVLPMAQEVDVPDQAPGQRFVEVQTDLNGDRLRGFVSSDLLREPVSPLKEALLHEAVKQWLRFNRGSGLENTDPFSGFVHEFWEAIGLHFTGRDKDEPWSAAFISFIVRQAGYVGFKFSAGHATYINDAKQKRDANDASAPFWLFRLNEHKPQLGDLICKRRQPGVTFDNLPEHFKGHCDVVVELRDNEVRGMGGNVSQSVSISSFATDGNGFVKQQGELIAIMRNNR